MMNFLAYHDQKKIENLINEVDVCVNLIGILYEKNKINSFKNIHSAFPDFISRLCNKNGTALIHLSALGLEKAKDSKYAKSKTDGEKGIKEVYKYSVIIRITRPIFC